MPPCYGARVNVSSCGRTPTPPSTSIFTASRIHYNNYTKTSAGNIVCVKTLISLSKSSSVKSLCATLIATVTIPHHFWSEFEKYDVRQKWTQCPVLPQLVTQRQQSSIPAAAAWHPTVLYPPLQGRYAGLLGSATMAFETRASSPVAKTA